MQESIHSLDPAEWGEDRLQSAAKEKLVSLVFEPLVRLDDNGHPQPVLALSWQHDSKCRRWSFRLRQDVKFHDGSAMIPETVAAALSALPADWKTSVSGDVLQIESETPIPDLLFDLARPSRSIFIRGTAQNISGTGPFHLAKWEPGKRVVLAANEQHWAGRPFLDGVTIEMGRAVSEQLMDLELGKADFIEIWPNEMRRIPKGTKTWASSPHVLIALAFERGRPASEDVRLREALALSIDRAAMHNWLMQKQGETAAALLPQQLSGYAFLFSAALDPKKARQLVSGPGQSRILSMAYDASDPLARTLADRIAVNAREAGITLNLSIRPANPDIRLVRLPIRTPSAGSALADVIAFFRLTPDIRPLPNNASIEALHAAEDAIIATNRIVPLFHVPEIFGSNRRVKTWMTTGIGPFGHWHFDDMWLESEKP
jgi:peptide/nickel transport system substrate-binding protein